MRQENHVRYVKECVAVESNKAKIINLFHASKSQLETERKMQTEGERGGERKKEREREKGSLSQRLNYVGKRMQQAMML